VNQNEIYEAFNQKISKTVIKVDPKWSVNQNGKLGGIGDHSSAVNEIHLV